MYAEEIARLDFEALFPVRTQTTGADRAFLLRVCELMGATRYSYASAQRTISPRSSSKRKRMCFARK